MIRSEGYRQILDNFWHSFRVVAGFGKFSLNMRVIDNFLGLR